MDSQIRVGHGFSLKIRTESEGLSKPELSEGDVVRRLMKKRRKIHFKKNKASCGDLDYGYRSLGRNCVLKYIWRRRG